MRRSIQLKWVKITRYEFWPVWLFYLPLFGYWLVLSLRRGDFLFFLRINKCMPYGGAIGANKIAPLHCLPAEFKPVTEFARQGAGAEELHEIIVQQGIQLPCILKPNNGERGKGVTLIRSHQDLEELTSRGGLKEDMILQEYANAPLEFGIFFFFDENELAHIPSVVMKEFLTIEGDGKKTVSELISGNERALLSNKSYLRNSDLDLGRVLASGEELNLEPIGNHCRGTKFLNANHLITPQMVDVFAQISRHIQGFQYGRFDIKAETIDSLYSGVGIKVVEVNGVNAEPAHIYDPSYGLFKAYKDLFRHMKIIYRLAKKQPHDHHTKMSLPQFIENVRRHLKPLA